MDRAEREELIHAMFGLAHQNLVSAEYLSTTQGAAIKDIKLDIRQSKKRI